MPLYEYVCQKCGKNHEAIQKISEPPLKKCPHCGGKLLKELSATAFQLKGGGWYKDGYASTAPAKPSGTTTETKSSEGSTKTETKTAAPAAKKD